MEDEDGLCFCRKREANDDDEILSLDESRSRVSPTRSFSVTSVVLYAYYKQIPLSEHRFWVIGIYYLSKTDSSWCYRFQLRKALTPISCK